MILNASLDPHTAPLAETGNLTYLRCLSTTSAYQNQSAKSKAKEISLKLQV